MPRFLTRLAARGWRLGRLARIATLTVVAAATMFAERALAPRAWDTVSYAWSYAEGHVAQGYWDQGLATAFVATRALTSFGPAVIIAMLPLLIGWLLSRGVRVRGDPPRSEDRHDWPGRAPTGSYRVLLSDHLPQTSA